MASTRGRRARARRRVHDGADAAPAVRAGPGERAARAVGAARATGAVHARRGRPRRRLACGRARGGAGRSATRSRALRACGGDAARQRASACRRRATSRSQSSRRVPGAIVANEVHDACPAHLLRWPHELPRRRRTTTAASQVVAGAAPGALRLIVERRRASTRAAPSYEVSPAQAELQTALAGRSSAARCSSSTTARRGPQRYLRPVPRLRTYLGGPAGRRSARRPGTQDITVDVDFGPCAPRVRARDCARRSTRRSRSGCGARRAGARRRRCRAASAERLWLEALARAEAAGASFRVLVQERA